MGHGLLGAHSPPCPGMCCHEAHQQDSREQGLLQPALSIQLGAVPAQPSPTPHCHPQKSPPTWQPPPAGDAAVFCAPALPVLPCVQPLPCHTWGYSVPITPHLQHRAGGQKVVFLGQEQHDPVLHWCCVHSGLNSAGKEGCEMQLVVLFSRAVGIICWLFFL